MQLLSAVLTLFLVMDPIGNVPMFMVYLRDVKGRRKLWVVARESIIALAVLLFFLFFGRQLMSLLGIGQESLHIAGGVLLMLISLEMIFPGRWQLGSLVGEESEGEGEPFIVPLAIPLIAGPSTMATIMILSSQPGLWNWVSGLVIAWVCSTAILLLASRFSWILGPRGLQAAERLMGMILTLVAVQMFLGGIRVFVENLRR
jgi:multiple antibiotic resistance protein